MIPRESNVKMQNHAKEAIDLAMKGRWQEAVTANKAILELTPEDVDAYNRLGRAFMELGEYTEAKGAYSHALDLDNYNSIARKNLDRLEHLANLPPAPKNDQSVSLDIFIEDAGKARVVNLILLAANEVIAKMAPGEKVDLVVEGQRLLVKNGRGEYLGEVHPKYGARLLKLIKGGNEYIAAISSLGENKVRVIIREVYQHPSQAGRLSFPQKNKGDFRPYSKETLLRHRLEEELAEESEGSTEEEEPGNSIVTNDFFEALGAENNHNEHILSEENGYRNS
ncbi:tetratricopeptide repeat protein [Chloroflexota bacterium]